MSVRVVPDSRDGRRETGSSAVEGWSVGILDLETTERISAMLDGLVVWGAPRTHWVDDGFDS